MGHDDTAPFLRAASHGEHARTPRSMTGSVVRSWRAAVHAGTARDPGWPEWINIPSKVAQVAEVRTVARQRRDADLRDGTLVAAVCPRLVDTATSRPWFTDFSQAALPRRPPPACWTSCWPSRARQLRRTGARRPGPALAQRHTLGHARHDQQLTAICLPPGP